MKVAFMFPNVPNPRFIKRMTLTSSIGISTFLLYWHRGISTPYTLPDEVHNIPIKLKVKLGDYKRKLLLLPLFLIISLFKLAKIRPGVMHVGNLDMLFIAFVYKILLNRKAKIIYEMGDLPKYIANKSNNPLKRVVRKSAARAERMLCRHIDLLILTSPHFWEVHYSRFIPKDKYMFIPNVPSRQIFDTFSKKIPGQKITIGYVGIIRYLKQLQILIEAVGEFQNDFDILIAGESSGSDDLYQFIEEKQAWPYVKWLGAYNYKSDIAAIYSQIDIIHSVYDLSFENVKVALPNKLYEAIVCEIPIIVAEQTELEKFVLTHQIGYSVGDSEVEDFKKLLRRLLANRRELEALEQNCRRIKSDYYLEKHHADLEDAYKKLFAGSYLDKRRVTSHA